MREIVHIQYQYNIQSSFFLTIILLMGDKEETGKHFNADMEHKQKFTVKLLYY